MTMTAVCLPFALVPVTACDDSPHSGDVPRPDLPSMAPSAKKPTRSFTRAGVTVHLPPSCRPGESSPVDCGGLRSLRIAKVGPLDDLIRPGVHRHGKQSWVGLRLVGNSYIFATASNAQVIRDLFASASG
jgi:hypothetical protein